MTISQYEQNSSSTEPNNPMKRILLVVVAVSVVMIAYMLKK